MRDERVIDEPARSEDAATKLATNQLTSELQAEPNATACPDCGRFQPDWVGLKNAKQHLRIAILGLIAVAIVAGIAFLSRMDGLVFGCLVGVVGLAAALAHSSISLMNPNRDLDANRTASRSHEEDGDLDVVKEGDRSKQKRALSPITRWHVIAHLCTFMAAIVLLAPAAAEIKTQQPTILEGYFNDPVRIEFPDRFDAIGGYWTAKPPRVTYRNLGYASLGRIISNVSGTRYQDYIRAKIMLPLGMTSTTYDIFASPKARRSIGYRWQDNRWVREPDMRDGAFGAMGGVETSAADYAKWVAFLLSAWPARDGPEIGPVKRATVREIVTGSNFVAATMRSPEAGGAPCRQASTYAMGWRAADDCDLGRFVSHGGGYPGYGSYVMLLPDKGVGLFAFSSKTYGGSSLPVWRAALALNKAGTLSDRTTPVSPGLAAAYDAARAVWRSGDIAAAPLANNILMDRDAASWSKTIAGVKTEVGGCPATEAIKPISAMEGNFTWTCSHGRLQGRVQRAPTPAMTIQALDYAVARP